MPDPIFAAEMATLIADRRARERGRIGDGMAAGYTDPERPDWHAGWMDFTGPRVPVHGHSGGPGTPSVDALRSTRHVHDTGCLVKVAGGIRPLATGEDREVPESGWVACSFNGVRYHQHSDRLMAHWIDNRLACPEGVTA
jgi:hypothetical protein